MGISNFVQDIFKNIVFFFFPIDPRIFKRLVHHVQDQLGASNLLRGSGGRG
jgi:hypothetical protein